MFFRFYYILYARVFQDLLLNFYIVLCRVIRIVWFGVPASNANFKTKIGIITTKYHPIIRFEGKYTAKLLFRFMRMSETIDQSNRFKLDEI